MDSVNSKRTETTSPFPLSVYFRLANLFIEQAKECREEKNIFALYVILARYAKLMSEVTSQHPSYLTYSTTEKLHHQKILEEFVKELKELKPLIRELFFDISRNVEDEMEDARSNGGNQVKCYISGEDKRPRQEWIPSHMYMVKSNNDHTIVYGEETGLASVVMADAGPDCSSSGSPSSTHLTSSRGCDIDCRPTPSVSCIHSLPEGAYGSLVNVTHWGQRHHKSSKSLVHDSSATKVMLDIHISARLMEDFLELARENTDKDLETCGVLGANLRNGTFYVTTLIIPKQESTSNSCQTLNEEEIYAIQDEQNLFPVGWIHTHPSQTCFLSSIDLHTHYSYQVMLPEAVAIVMAPTDTTRISGIFRLTDPAGISTLKECQERGFHPHREPADGSPIYEECSDVYMNSNLREVDSIDLRKKLPFSVGLLLRMLRKNLRVFVTCTTGFDRSPACVIANLHWIQDTALHVAYNFVTGLHSCWSDRPAIVWATWDLIAMVENGWHEWSSNSCCELCVESWVQGGEEVHLIGDFTGNWKETIRAVRPKYEVELRLPQGKYYYKFIVGGQWKHSHHYQLKLMNVSLEWETLPA